MRSRWTAPFPSTNRSTALIAAALAAACGGAEAPVAPQVPNPSPPTAMWSQVEAFRADLAAPRSPADGAGTVALVEAPDTVRCGERGRWTLELTVGPKGIAEGGAVVFMPDPFWGWSTPQRERRDLPGYTPITTTRGDDVTLSYATIGGAEGGQMFATLTRGSLDAGDIVRIEYGAGEAMAYADRYADAAARLWVGVDGDGDGVRALIAESPSVRVLPRDPERLVLLGPSIARPGETVRYHVSAVDFWANRAPDAAGDWYRRVELEGVPETWDAPEFVDLGAEGFAAFDVVVGPAQSAPTRMRATLWLQSNEALRATANPLLVDAEAPRSYWADLHGHSGLSDGTGAVRDYFTYARDTARLDVVALTDHDHFGPRFLDAHGELRGRIAAATESFHVPGRFVAVHGYEWTNWVHGHRHVLSFTNGIELRSSLDDAFDTPAELWDALRGTPSMTIAHHSSGQPVPVNWTYAPDPVLEPVTEIVSVHGSSEARDAPFVVRGSRDGQFVRDQLERGYRLGFIGSSDSHDGHPGLAHLSPGYGWRKASRSRQDLVGTAGLAAIQCATLERASILAALRSRNAYATSGPRTIALVSRDGDHVTLRYHGTAPIRAIDVVRGGVEGAAPEVIADTEHTGSLDATARYRVLAGGRYGYLRVVQTDGGTTWIGPVFRD